MSNNFDEDDIQTRKALLIDHIIALTVPVVDPAKAALNIAAIYQIADSGLFENFKNNKIDIDDLNHELLKFINNKK